MAERYQIQNVTKKPKPASGPDTRDLVAKNGCFVQYRNATGNNVIMGVGAVRIVNELNDDHIALLAQGHLSVETIEDITSSLKKHVAHVPQQRMTGVEHTAEAARSGRKSTRSAKAALMGEAQKAVGVTELEGAVNPDGAANFTFTAKKGALPKRQRR